MQPANIGITVPCAPRGPSAFPQEGAFSALPEGDRAFKKACAAPGDAGSKFVSGVGIGVFVTHPDRPGCVLLSRRKSSAGAGTWALPGGHLELGESFEQCAVREAREETGLELREVKVVAVNNAVDAPSKYHYVVFFLRGVASSTEPVNLVPRTSHLHPLLTPLCSCTDRGRVSFLSLFLTVERICPQEPEKHDDWAWIQWDSSSFPSPLFTALDNVRTQGLDPFTV